MKQPWVGTTAIVTGASGTIGAACAAGLLAAGMHVVLAARHGRRLAMVHDRLVGIGNERVHVVETNVASARSVAHLGDEVTDRPVCTVIVNAAGTAGKLAPLLDTSPREWDVTMRSNLGGAFLVARQFAPAMVDHGWGRIINVTSAAAVHPPAPLMAAYRTSKVALNALTAALAFELHDTGVTVNAVHPGNVISRMSRDIRAQADASGPRGHHMRAWAESLATDGDDPEAAARLIAGLLLDGRTGWLMGVGDADLDRPLEGTG